MLHESCRFSECDHNHICYIYHYILYIVTVISHIRGYSELISVKEAQQPVCNTYRTVLEHKGNIFKCYISTAFPLTLTTHSIHYVSSLTHRSGWVSSGLWGHQQPRHQLFKPAFNHLRSSESTTVCLNSNISTLLTDCVSGMWFCNTCTLGCVLG